MKAVFRFLAVPFLLVVLGLALTGCGGGGDSYPVWFSGTPDSPTNVSVVSGDGKAIVSWNPVAGAKSYNIYYSTTPDAKATSGKIENATSPYTVTGLTNGLTYYFSVTAVNEYGESGGSAEESVVPSPIPAAPTGINVTAADGQIAVSWTAVEGATAYNIYYATSSGVTKTTGIKVAGAVSPRTITGLTNGTTYYVVVTAANDAGESAESSEGFATPTAAVSPPGIPTGVTATAGNQKVTIGWQAVSGATSYNIYYATNPSVSKTTGTKIAGVVSPHTLTGLSNGVTYYFVVTAVNDSGESAESSVKYATPTVILPTKPTDLTLTPGDTSITLDWTAVDGATTYNIYYATSSPVTKSSTKISVASTSYTVTGLTNGVTYYFAVSAVNSAGESALSDQEDMAPGVPARPKGSSAYAGNGQAVVYCQPVTYATSYNIYYSETAGVTPSSYTWKITGASNPQVVSLTNGKTYYFVITAVNAAGEGTQYSAETSATPSATQPQSPPSPAGVSVLAGSGSVTVTWYTCYAATSYNIYYLASSSANTATVIATGTKINVAAATFGVDTTQSYTVTGLAGSTDYRFVVTAQNAGGESAGQNSPKPVTTLP